MRTIARAETRRNSAPRSEVAASVLIFSGMAIVVPVLLIQILHELGTSAGGEFAPWAPLFWATAALTRAFGLLILGVVAIACTAASAGAVRLGVERGRRPVTVGATYAASALVSALGWLYLLAR